MSIQENSKVDITGIHSFSINFNKEKTFDDYMNKDSGYSFSGEPDEKRSQLEELIDNMKNK